MSNRNVLLVIDIQKEYITPGRPYFIQGITPSLQNCKNVINHARKNLIPLWHMAHKQKGDLFGIEHPLSEFIEGFEPTKGECVFKKDLYSCFSSASFTESCKTYKPNKIFVIGYGTSMCCLSTIIDGIHRGYKFTLIEDATAARAMPYASEIEMHYAAINIIRAYAEVMKTSDFLEWSTR